MQSSPVSLDQAGTRDPQRFRDRILVWSGHEAPVSFPVRALLRALGATHMATRAYRQSAGVRFAALTQLHDPGTIDDATVQL